MILHGDALTMLKTLPDESVQTCVTSPPYWGLRDYGIDGQLGLEKTPEEYVQNMVNVFREVRRVLRKDGTLWLNLGDSYNGSGGAGGDYGEGGLKEGQPKFPGRNIGNLKPKDLCGIPWRVAFALQSDGWWLRQDIIWYKRNPMPESVTDRCTKAHEYIFLLTKSARYFYDAEAVKEPLSLTASYGGTYATHTKSFNMQGNIGRAGMTIEKPVDGSRNLRSVWDITTKGFPGAHFATFPPEIPERCIKAGTSEKGCCEKCGSPVERVVENKPMEIDRSNNHPAELRTRTSGTMTAPAESRTIGGQPTCSCNAGTKPCVVLDPFAGAGTTLWVAKRLGRKFIGIELNEKYIQDHIEPRLAQVNPLFEVA